MCNVSCQFLFLSVLPCSQMIPFYCNTFLFRGCSILPYFSGKINFNFFYYFLNCLFSELPCLFWSLLCGDFPKMSVTQSSLFIFYRETLGALGDQEGGAGRLVALGVGWLGGRPALSCGKSSSLLTPKYYHVLVFCLGWFSFSGKGSIICFYFSIISLKYF